MQILNTEAKEIHATCGSPETRLIFSVVRESLLPYDYVRETGTLRRSRGTVGGVETESEITDQSEFTKQHSTE